MDLPPQAAQGELTQWQSPSLRVRSANGVGSIPTLPTCSEVQPMQNRSNRLAARCFRAFNSEKVRAMKRMIQRVAFVVFGVLLFNVAWNVAGSIAITPNSPDPVVYTVVSEQ